MTKRNYQANNDSIFSHAIKYAKQGYEVFPLVPGQKIPATKNGCNDATTDIEQIERWIKEFPQISASKPVRMHYTSTSTTKMAKMVQVIFWKLK